MLCKVFVIFITKVFVISDYSIDVCVTIFAGFDAENEELVNVEDEAFDDEDDFYEDYEDSYDEE